MSTEEITLTEPVASAVAVAITDEFLSALAQDQADLGPSDLPIAEWSMVLTAGVGAVARHALDGAVTGDLDKVRAAAIQLGADLLGMIEQLDGDSGRAADLLGDSTAAHATLEGQIVDDGRLLAAEEPQDSVVRHVDFTAGQAEPDISHWNGDRWRTNLRSWGVRVADALRYAQNAARAIGAPEPGTLDEIRHPALAADLRSWCEQQAAPA